MKPNPGHRLTDRGKESTLLQLWTSQRLRLFARAAAILCGQNLSAFVRESIWERCERVLSDRDKERLEKHTKQQPRKENIND